MGYVICCEFRNLLVILNEIGFFCKNNVICLFKENENGICEIIYFIIDCDVEEFLKFFRFKS